MKKFFSFRRGSKGKATPGERNRVLTAAEIAAQEEQKRKLEEQQAQAAARLKAQRSAKAAQPRNRIVTGDEPAQTESATARKRWFKRTKRTAQEREARRSKNSMGPVVRDILSGEFLTREGVTRHIPYLIFVSVLFIAYIAMGYQFERLEREKLKTKRQLEELSAEYKTLKAEFETELQQSTVEQNIAELGLRQTVEPPFLLEYQPVAP